MTITNAVEPKPSEKAAKQRALTLSFVIPAFNEAANITKTIERVDTYARDHVDEFEIIIVDDGSSDDTFEIAKALAASYPLRLLRLSRNFGKEHAIMAGLEKSVGAAVVILDADLQEPLSHLETMLEKHAEGFEMVYTVRAQRLDETWRKRIFTRIFYTMLNFGSKTVIPADARDFRLMDRRVVDALCALPERNRFMKGLYGWVGFRSTAIPIELERREAGISKFGFTGLFRLGLTGLTSFSAWPLRIWTAIGMLVAMFSILYGVVIIIRTLVYGIDVPGWSTLAVAVMLLGGVQLISIGVLGEYLSRVFTEVKGRPGFIIAEDHSAAREND